MAEIKRYAWLAGLAVIIAAFLPPGASVNVTG